MALARYAVPSERRRLAAFAVATITHTRADASQVSPAATKIEMLSYVDLKTGRADAQLKLSPTQARLQYSTVLAVVDGVTPGCTASLTAPTRCCRMSPPGLSLVRAISLDRGRGIYRSTWATLLFPEELSLSVRDPRAAAQRASLQVDFDRVELRQY